MESRSKRLKGIPGDHTGSARKAPGRPRQLIWLGLQVALFTVVAGPLGAVERVGCSSNGGITTCRIDEPKVTQRITPYPQITFHPGDRVSVSAGGCVQTGGAGRTWKRYVNPSGPNSGRLYHGLIQLPGVHSGLVRIAGVLNSPVVIPASVDPHTAILHLGYEDDGYGDNGYWNHDDGTEDQCRGVGNAFVEIRMDHSGPTPPPSSAPFDLVWQQVDANGFPLNATWAWQRDHPGSLPNADTQCFPLSGVFSNRQCSTQSPSLDEPDGWNATWCAVGAQHSIHGHVNWMPTTWEGPIAWDGHSSPGTDDDYNINVTPPNQDGLTVSNDGQIHCEFDSDETIDHFRTAWWRSFHSAVDDSDASANALINQHQAIIVGLAGLDCEHGCATELHPVYALALQVNNNPGDDTWAMFVRNWGDEGYCSQDQHYLDTNRIAFRISRPGATGVSVNVATSFLTNSSEASGPKVTLLPGQGALVEFGLPDPTKGARINGELHLQWTVGPQAAQPMKAVFLHASAALGPRLVETEKRLTTLTGQLTPERRQVLRTRLARPVVFDEVSLKKLEGPVGVTPSHPALVRHQRDTQKAEKDRLRAEAICAAFGGNVPGQPNACATVAH
jgi:hypothetical protein